MFKSWWRIAQAFFWCAVIAIPLGLLMGSFRWVHDLVNPVAAPMRSMPITAFLPAFIALFGMDETMKVAFLWFGMFFYLLAVVVEEVEPRGSTACSKPPTRSAPRRPHVLWLMFRASFPAIFGSFRILYDIGWTYVILAEMVNARKGVGYMVEAARKVLDFERVYAGHHRHRHGGVPVPLAADASWSAAVSRGAGHPARHREPTAAIAEPERR